MIDLYNKPVARLAWTQMLRTRKGLFALLVSLIPLAAGVLIMTQDFASSHRPTYNFRPQFTNTVSFLVMGGTVPFLSLLLAGGLLADEAEDRTLTYLLTRPVRRRALYASKFLPIAAAAMALGALQVLLFAVTRLLAYVFVGQGSTVNLVDSHGTVTGTMDAGLLILVVLVPAMLTAMLAAAAFTALFAFVSLLTTRFHFFVNLVVYILDLGFGQVGGGGLGNLTVTYYAESLLQGSDPSSIGLVSQGASWYVASVLLLAMVALWLWLGMRKAERRDFNITSAAT